MEYPEWQGQIKKTILYRKPLALSGWSRRFSEEYLGTPGYQKVRHGADFLVALFLVKCPSWFIEVRHTSKQIPGSLKHESLDVLQQLTAGSPLSGPDGHT